MKNSPLKSSSVARSKGIFHRAAAALSAACIFLAPVMGVEGASPLLNVKEPEGVGLLGDPRSFAKLGEPRDFPASGRSFASVAETRRLHREAMGLKPLPIYYLFCTVYYTPMESGFTEAGGFDMTLETRSGLAGRKFAKSFLRAVVTEGFGRVATPYKGMHYIKYDGRWGFSKSALGNRNNVLKDRISAAVHRKNPLFGKGTRIAVLDPEVANTFGNIHFEAADTGGGLYYSQIDLYWGEDDPLGPGVDIFRPASCDVAVRWIVPVEVGP